MNWIQKPLGELVTIRTGRLDANAMVENGKYPFFTCSREVFKINEYAFDCKAILLAGNNASGDFNVKYYEGKFNAYQRTYVITINNEEKLLYIYLKNKLESHLKVFKNQAIGANTRFIKIGMITDIQIPLPPLFVQQKIVAILNTAEEYKQKTKVLIDKYEQLTQSLFLDMFGDPKTNSKKWKLVPFTDVLVLKRGYDLPVQDRKEGKIPIMASNGILGFHDTYKVKGPGVVTGRSGTLGSVHYIKDDYWPLNTALYSKDMNGNNPLYLLYLLRNFNVERYSRGAGVPTLNRNLIHSELIMNTPLPLQNQFAERIQLIESQKQQAHASLQKVENLFNSLLQRAFNGELTAE